MEINPRYKNINILNFLNDIEMVPLSKQTYFIHLIHFTHFFPFSQTRAFSYVKTKDCSASIDSYLKTYEINVMEICHKPRHKLKVCKTHKKSHVSFLH